MANETFDTSDLSKPGYYIVNPSGTVHECTRDHARMRLRQVGWRMATDEEVAAYAEVHLEIDTGEEDDRGRPITKAGRGQGVGSPIAEAYSSDPDAILQARADEQLAEADEQGGETEEDSERDEPEGDDDADGSEGSDSDGGPNGGSQQEGEEADEAPETQEEAEEED